MINCTTTIAAQTPFKPNSKGKNTAAAGKAARTSPYTIRDEYLLSLMALKYSVVTRENANNGKEKDENSRADSKTLAVSADAP